MTPHNDLRNVSAIAVVAAAVLGLRPDATLLPGLALSGPHGAAVVAAVHAAMAPLGDLGHAGERLAERVDGAFAGETGFLGDLSPLGAVATGAALELALRAIGNAWAPLVDDALTEAERVDCGARGPLPHAQQLAAAALAVVQAMAAPPVLAAMREAGIAGARLAAAVIDFAPAARHHAVVMRRRLAPPRRLRRLFTRDTGQRAATDVTRDLLLGFARIGAVVIETGAGAAVETVAMDGLFVALAAGLRLAPASETDRKDAS